MSGPVTTRGALLQALRQGPGYGRELVRRVALRTNGRLRLSEARVYPTLRSLNKAGLVRSSRVAPKGRRGARERTYYDLTPRGIELSTTERGVLGALIGWGEAGRLPDARERARMAARILEAEELSGGAEEVRAAMARTRRG